MSKHNNTDCEESSTSKRPRITCDVTNSLYNKCNSMIEMSASLTELKEKIAQLETVVAKQQIEINDLKKHKKQHMTNSKKIETKPTVDKSSDETEEIKELRKVLEDLKKIEDEDAESIESLTIFSKFVTCLAVLEEDHFMLYDWIKILSERTKDSEDIEEKIEIFKLIEEIGKKSILIYEAQNGLKDPTMYELLAVTRMSLYDIITDEEESLKYYNGAIDTFKEVLEVNIGQERLEEAKMLKKMINDFESFTDKEFDFE